MLRDNHGRVLNYLRLAITDRCNLRCAYCMPDSGLEWTPREELMTLNEMLRLCALLVENGIEKIRITGGEPFIRKDIIELLTGLSKLRYLKQLTITTNGTLTAPWIPQLKELGIHSINLSLDSMDSKRFQEITKRDELHLVLGTLTQLLAHKIEIKVNAVVMEGKNTEDIIPFVELTRGFPISVRFIEEMPFNGQGKIRPSLVWNSVKIFQTIKENFPSIRKIKDPGNSTSINFRIPGFKGTIGIIPAYTRSFCGTCNRIRITPQGILKTCLYDSGVLNVKELLRSGFSDQAILLTLTAAITNRAKDGWEAEKIRDQNGSFNQSMATIGG